MLDVLARDQFLDALTDDFRLRVRQNHPLTLYRALEMALELESIKLANQQNHVVREVSLQKEGSLVELGRCAKRPPIKE